MAKQSDTYLKQDRGLSGAIIARIASAFGKNRILIALTLSYIIAGKIISIIYSIPFNTLAPLNLLQMLLVILPIFLVSMIVWRFSHMLFQIRPEKPIQWLGKDLLNILLLDRDRITGGIVAIFSIILVIGTLSFLKESIPVINPFSWDPSFAKLDQLVHGGVDPYALLTPIFANPVMTKLADTSYSVWFSLVYFFAFTATMDSDNPRRRNRYLFAFFLCWIFGGSVSATIFSSVGPVYYEVFGYGAHYAPLLSILHEINEVQPMLALELHVALLDGYQNGGELTGISAMPSMHLAMAWLMVFQAFIYGRIVGWLMVAFAVLIQLSSVYLAWHYAIDGYAGFLVALVCWKVAKPLAGLQARYDR